ncbi:ABC transporter permease subunit [Gordonia rubripertincta]|uniref:ABC transporter permease subunit n=2 Tax=Gordonia rubripertincta TaxID=36822 RepID=A0AAW6R841_GORRU|nr:ABC transporter permease subunit [Gordonia rubripertincta]MBM7279948.1 ABC transporter permease subunit [Gordonia rubripertincta]MDG6780947.1 ABC transporter permease subunit [Gordonia rubripertincta]NKY66049.1 ABC transporter permease subunit [Gordonia rubripertincta]TSD94323.1 ABC transporter permease subunit [Gordonia rubripertincta]GAB85619.1 putative ABC transporter permease protein [Gordonia rubripertincta NBRC 101908]
MAEFGSVRWLAGLGGIAGLIVVWWATGAMELFGGTVPTPWAVLAEIGETGSTYYVDNFSLTVELALRGFLWGNGLAIALAVIVILFPPVEGLATQLAILSYCTPIIAVAPIIQVAFAEVTTMIVFLAAISVFFTTMIGTLSGLRSPHAGSLDLVKVYGGGRFAQLWRVRSVAALPNTLAAIKIAAPAAVLGAVLGEFLAMPETGAGPAMIIAQQSGNIPQVWAIALISGAVAGLGYAVVAVIAKYATAWSNGTAAGR